MTKENKTLERNKDSRPKKDPDLKTLVDQNGEPVISDDDPDLIPPPDEELETTPPYVPPPPAEGP